MEFTKIRCGLFRAVGWICWNEEDCPEYYETHSGIHDLVRDVLDKMISLPEPLLQSHGKGKIQVTASMAFDLVPSLPSTRDLDSVKNSLAQPHAAIPARLEGQ